jgi:protein gp37
MSDRSAIEWTDATWNPVTGCSVVSPGCTNCYAMKLAGTRLQHHPSRAGLTTNTKTGPVWTGDVRFNKEWLEQPLQWKRRRMIFVCAHGDLFHEEVIDHWIDEIFSVMAASPQHRFQVLTKRSARMRAYMTKRVRPSLPNVWIGVSAEDQKRADARIPDLLATPAAVRFVSLEPLINSISLWNNDKGVWRGPGIIKSGGVTPSTVHGPAEGYDDSQPGLDWVIVGGESGPGARAMHPDWARSLRDECAAADVPFFFKQWGAWLPWEQDQLPCWRSQNGQLVDRHALFPDNMDDHPDWDDGLWGIPGASHAVFQRVGKSDAGRTLDGVIHSGMPAP